MSVSVANTLQSFSIKLLVGSPARHTGTGALDQNPLQLPWSTQNHKSAQEQLAQKQTQQNEASIGQQGKYLSCLTSLSENMTVSYEDQDCQVNSLPDAGAKAGEGVYLLVLRGQRLRGDLAKLFLPRGQRLRGDLAKLFLPWGQSSAHLHFHALKSKGSAGLDFWVTGVCGSRAGNGSRSSHDGAAQKLSRALLPSSHHHSPYQRLLPSSLTPPIPKAPALQPDTPHPEGSCPPATTTPHPKGSCPPATITPHPKGSCPPATITPHPKGSCPPATITPHALETGGSHYSLLTQTDRQTLYLEQRLNAGLEHHVCIEEEGAEQGLGVACQLCQDARQLDIHGSGVGRSQRGSSSGQSTLLFSCTHSSS
ncbi:hypothetical protein JZ751_012672 [Albula glossodonta]|uniref:Uncharacterized protein n=1 Tax=Albula glossodonta TaxID=121402 RepID=A0A8T2N6T7_9TELE|nr:hypothetical protein JZ751_012672 [Albula glossodonta]